MLKKKNKTCSGNVKIRPGFTLAEIILVVALTLFLLTVTMQGFVNSASQFSFSNVSLKVEEMIRTARSLAISGKAQIDYTDYNNDTCINSADSLDACMTKNTATGGDDYVTPAHYGVNISKTPPVLPGDPDKYTVILFSDSHAPAGTDPTLVEGKFNPGNSVPDYKLGKDIILDTFPVPAGMKLIIPKTDGTTVPGDGTSATIFFSPIFADVSSDVTILSTDPFFRFGVSQSNGDIVRKHCSQVHMLAGISEPANVATPTAALYCP